MKNYSKFFGIIICFVVFGISTPSEANALTTCVNQPASTLSWSYADCSGTPTIGGGGVSVCDAYPATSINGSGNKSIPSGTACTATISCDISSDSSTLAVNTAQIWNGTSCIARTWTKYCTGADDPLPWQIWEYDNAHQTGLVFYRQVKANPIATDVPYCIEPTPTASLTVNGGSSASGVLGTNFTYVLGSGNGAKSCKVIETPGNFTVVDKNDDVTSKTLDAQTGVGNWTYTATCYSRIDGGGKASTPVVVTVNVTAPASCTLQAKTWNTNCSGTVPATNHGANSTSVTNTAGGYTGSATFACNNGTFTVNSGATCNQLASCGSSHTQSFTSAPASNLCSVGLSSFSDSVGSDGSFNWTCTGSGSSNIVACTATKTSFSCTGNTPADATMCSGDGTGLLSDVGRTVVLSCTPGTKCEYQCVPGHYRTSSTVCSQCTANDYCPGGGDTRIDCPANHTSPVGSDSIGDCVPTPGVCGSSAGVATYNAPSSNLCATSGGSPSGVTDMGSWFSWTCTLGSATSCTANQKIDGVCSTFAEQCTAGTYVNSPADTGSDYRWTCNGINTGNNSSTCTKAIPAQPQCSDGSDNDGDGKTDYPTDPGCSNASDTDENAMSGDVNAVPAFCAINSGASTCDVTLSWSVFDRIGATTAITRDGTGGNLYTGHTNASQSTAVPYEDDGTVIYRLYNNGSNLDSVSVAVSCVVGTLWDSGSGTCAPIAFSCSGTAPTGSNFTSRGALTGNNTWAYATAGECTWSCNANYYKSGSSCVACPGGQTSPVGSDAIGDCVGGSMSGTLTPSASSCTITAGNSTCNVNLTWSTTNPVATSAVTRNNPSGTVFTANSGTAQSTAVSGAYASVTYYLYNNAVLLATSPAITASCTGSTAWNGTTCQTCSNGGCTTGLCDNDATNPPSCNVCPTNSGLYWDGNSCEPCTNGGCTSCNASSANPTKDCLCINGGSNPGVCTPPAGMSGTLTPSATSCTITAGNSTCNVNLTWSTTNPVATSAVTRNNPSATVFNANSGTAQSTAVSGAYASVTYYLYNNAVLLATSPAITASCTGSTAWNGTTCQTCSNGGCTNGICNNGATNPPSCTVCPTSSGLYWDGNSCEPCGNGGCTSCNASSANPTKDCLCINGGSNPGVCTPLGGASATLTVPSCTVTVAGTGSCLSSVSWVSSSTTWPISVRQNDTQFSLSPSNSSVLRNLYYNQSLNSTFNFYHNNGVLLATKIGVASCSNIPGNVLVGLGVLCVTCNNGGCDPGPICKNGATNPPTCTPPPTVASFINNGPIISGASATLTWGAVTGTGVNCNINNGIGSATPLSGGNRSTGALVASTTYTLTCSNAGGSVTKQTTVMVNGPMSGTLDASPLSCTVINGQAGCSSSFTWTTTNPVGTSQVVADGGLGPNSTPANNDTQTLAAKYIDGTTPHIFRLYNNSVDLAQRGVVADCASSSAWDGNSCEACANGGCTNHVCNNGASDPPTCTPPGGASATITVPPCTIVTSGDSTCTSDVSWTSSNRIPPVSVRQNGVEFSTLATRASGPLRILTYGNAAANTFTFYHDVRIATGAATLLDTEVGIVSCSNVAGNVLAPSGGSCVTCNNGGCDPGPICKNGANNPPLCNACTPPLVWNTVSSSCGAPLSISTPGNQSITLPTTEFTASYILTNGTGGNSDCYLLNNSLAVISTDTGCTGSFTWDTPASPGDYGYHVRAVKSSTSETKTSGMFTITVNPAGAPSATLTVPSCTIVTPGDSTCTSNVSWVSNDTSNAVSIKQQLTEFSTSKNHPGMPRTLIYGNAPNNTFIFFDIINDTTLDWKVGTVSCSNVAGNVLVGSGGSCVACSNGGCDPGPVCSNGANNPPSCNVCPPNSGLYWDGNSCEPCGNGGCNSCSTSSVAPTNGCVCNTVGATPPLCSNMTGTLTTPSPTCTMTLGQGTCNQSFTWTTTNPVGTSQVVADGALGPNSTPANNDTQTLALKRGVNTLRLYNNSSDLAQAVVTADCSLNTTWDTINSVCADPEVGPVDVSGQHYYTTPEAISFTCSNSTHYKVIKSGPPDVTFGPYVYAGPVQFSMAPVGRGTGNYSISCIHGSVESVPTSKYYDSSAPVTSYVSIDAYPKTINAKGKSAISWSVTSPTAGCKLEVKAVCKNNTCSTVETQAAESIQTIVNTGYVDNSSSILIRNAVKTIALGQSGPTAKALGKKTFTIDYTTDFTVDCGGGKKSTTRVRVANSQEQ